MAAVPLGDGTASTPGAIAFGGASGTELAGANVDAELAACASPPARGVPLEIPQTTPTAMSTPAATPAIPNVRDQFRAAVAADPVSTCTPSRPVPEAAVVLAPTWNCSGTTVSNAARTATI
jgi:hypothetical protein